MRQILISISILFFLAFIIPKTESEGKPAEFYFSKAESEREKKDFKAAYRDYSKAIELKNDYAEAFYKRALLKVDMDSSKSALIDLDKVIELKPTGEVYYHRGHIKWTLKDSIGACQDWVQSCDFLYNHGCDLIREKCK